MLTPRGLLVRAGVLTAAYLACHFAGLREFTSVLCGTFPDPGGFPWVKGFFGLVYVFLYVAKTVLVPVLILTAAMLFVWDRPRARPLRYRAPFIP